MGADGGINWVIVKRPELKQRAIELLYPLGFFEYQMRDEDYRWMEKNDLPEYCLISKYGTDMADSGFLELRDMFGDDSFPDDDLTFEEVVEDLVTRPVWEFYEISKLEQLIVKGCWYNLWFDLFSSFHYTRTEMGFLDADRMKILEYKDRLGPLLKMKISEWKKEIKNILDVKRIELAETWT